MCDAKDSLLRQKETFKQVTNLEITASMFIDTMTKKILFEISISNMWEVSGSQLLLIIRCKDNL